MRKNSAIKLILFSVLGIAFLWLSKEMLFPSNYYGFGFNFNGIYGGEHMYMNGIYGNGIGSFSVLLVLLIKFLIIIFFITLLVGLLMAAKNYFFTAQDFAAFSNDFIPVQKPKNSCEKCGKNLEKEWKVCPYCAAEVKEN